MHCIFCKIVAGEIPSNKVYEDETILAFYDIEPAAPVHIVVIPKTHIASLNEISGAIASNIFEAIAQIAKEQALDKGYRVVCNCGEQGGQTVAHLHFHLLSGRNLQWPPG